MTWEERLLFLMYLDYRGVLKKWEWNHDNCDRGLKKIDCDTFYATDGFVWECSKEGHYFWEDIIFDWTDRQTFSVSSLDYEIHFALKTNQLKIGCQTITKKDALKIADFIYECFGEQV